MVYVIYCDKTFSNCSDLLANSDSEHAFHSESHALSVSVGRPWTFPYFVSRLKTLSEVVTCLHDIYCTLKQFHTSMQLYFVSSGKYFSHYSIYIVVMTRMLIYDGNMYVIYMFGFDPNAKIYGIYISLIWKHIMENFLFLFW